MKKNAGFSLIELLITVVVLTIASGAAISMIYQSQFVYTTQTEAADASNNVRAAMDQIVRTIRQAGSDPLETISTPGVQILGDGYVRISSDLTGSVASTTGNPMESTGDPDGTLNSIGEVVTFRYDPDSEQLLMNMGYGESVLAPNITEFNLSYFNATGASTTIDADIALVRINMTGKSEDTDLQTGRRNAVSLNSEVFVRSKTASIF